MGIGSFLKARKVKQFRQQRVRVADLRLRRTVTRKDQQALDRAELQELKLQGKQRKVSRELKQERFKQSKLGRAIGIAKASRPSQLRKTTVGKVVVAANKGLSQRQASTRPSLPPREPVSLFGAPQKKRRDDEFRPI